MWEYHRLSEDLFRHRLQVGILHTSLAIGQYHRVVNGYAQTEISLEDQACQTDLPYYPNSPQTMRSFSLADLRHAVANDHCYVSSYGNPIPSSNDSVPDNLNNISLSKNCQKRLQFTGIEAKYTALNEQQSDDERWSEISDWSGILFH